MLFTLTHCFLAAQAVAVSPSKDEFAQAHTWSQANLAGNQSPFAFNYGGQPFTKIRTTWNVVHSSKRLDGNRTGLVTTWTDPATGLLVRCVAIEYADFATVEWTLYFKNTGTNGTPILSDIQTVDLRLTRGDKGEFVLNHHAGDNNTPDSYEPKRLTLKPKSEQRFASTGGRPTQTGFPYFNIEWPGEEGGARLPTSRLANTLAPPENAEGVIVVLGWPGQWAAQFTRDDAKGLRVRGGQELTHFTLHPGEGVRSPLVALQFWKGDRVRAQNIWRRWMLAHNLPRDREGKLPRPMFGMCSGGFFPGLRTSEEDERRFINAYHQAGIKVDYWDIDAGWYACQNWPQIGTWILDAERFPRGFKPVSDLLHQHGTSLIVWFEPERVTPGTFLYTNNAAWLLGKDGEQKLLNLGNADARKWITDHVDAMLAREGIDYYRQDFNFDPLPFWRANDTPARQGITEIRHVEGYLAYWDELRRRHPGLLIDTCASGGRRNDLETLRRSVPLLRSDYQAFDGNSAYAPGNQGHTYGLSSWIPYYGQGVYFTERDYVYSLRSSRSPAFARAADVRKPNVDWALIRRMSEQWREVADCFLGDFYPLISYQLNEEMWIAWQFDLPERGKGMVQVFRRAKSNYESARFKLHGLEANARYIVTDLDNPGANQQFTGHELMTNGLLVTAATQPSAMLISYQKSP